MIISHRHRFIFLKTRKSAGTSVELALSRLAGPDDVLTKLSSESEPMRAGRGRGGQNDRGRFNPLPEMLLGSLRTKHRAVREYLSGRKFWNHMPAFLIRCRAGREVYDSYFKFCFERNPWDKTISHYYWLRHRRGLDGLDFAEYLRMRRFPVDFPRYTIGGRPAVDWIGRCERLGEDLAEALARVGVEPDVTLPRAKGGYRDPASRPYQRFLEPEHREAIGRAYAREIALLGYRFEEAVREGPWTADSVRE